MKPLGEFRVQATGGSFVVITNPTATELDSRLIPLAIAGVSFVANVLYGVFRLVKSRRNRRSEARPEIVTGRSSLARLKNRIQLYGGFTIYGFMVARLFGTLYLLYLSIQISRVCKGPLDKSVVTECPEIFITLTFLYSTILATISLMSTSWNAITARFNNTILLSTFILYVYRDLWPLATYSQVPADAAEGHIIWEKIFVLGITAILIPLFIPRHYVPVDPKHPMPTPNPELTVPWISRLTFSHMDPVVVLGSKVSHIPYDELPPLSDEDWASNQTKWAFPRVDPHAGAKRRHIVFGLLRHFRKEYLIMTISILFNCGFSFLVPIGINRVLNYLETGGTNSDIKPWFWIIWLLLGPITQSIATHWYLFHATVVRVRLEGIITQLVFEHSLRIRLKAEASSADEKAPIPSEEASVASTDDDGESTIGGHASRTEDGTSSTEGSTIAASASRGTSESTQGTIKGKSKAKAKADDTQPEPTKKSGGDTENMLGKINNFVTTDLRIIIDGSDFLGLVVQVPVRIALGTIFLYKILGWSSIVGLVATIACSPAAGLVGKLVQDAQGAKMKKTDARVQIITEAVGILRMIKLFGWEGKMAKRIEERREEELALLWKTKLLSMANSCVGMLIPMMSILITYGSYTVIMKEELNASKIFSSMAVFNILSDELQRISWEVVFMIQAKVSVDRINGFLKNTELLDSFTESQEAKTLHQAEESSEVGFRNATFGWSVDNDDGALTPSSRTYRLRIDGDLLFKRGSVNLIIGPTGSGKTSMLMALLGEMHFIPSNPDSWFNLPRSGGVAYAAQESWVQNATIRNNILFGSPYDEVRYKKVITQCALERDLELFDAGDATEVGERGLTLSGGQKARVTLARAIYSQAQMILLDDVFAALDVHTSAWIMDKCLNGDLVKGRTILLVTHNVALAGPVADFVVSLGLDGSVKSQGTEVSVALATDPTLASEVEMEKEQAEIQNQKIEEPAAEGLKAAPDGKLIMAEEIVHGHVTWKSMSLLLSALAGNHSVFFWLSCMVGLTVSGVVNTLELWFLGVWGSQYETHHSSEVNLTYYLSILTAIIIAEITFSCAVELYYDWRTVAASRTIHANLVDSVFGSTLRWLDETPTARIIARCTQDIRAVDGPVVQSLWWVVRQVFGVVIKLGVIVLLTPMFLVPGVVVTVVGILVGNVYLKAQLSVKREMSNARSPLLAHVSAAIHGLVSVRAYGAQESFKEDCLKRIDHYSRTARTSWDLNRWVGFRIESLGATFTAALAAYLVYGKQVGAANTGFSLTLATSFCSYIFWLIRIYNMLEVESNSLERIQGYIDIEHEAKPTESGRPPAAWPTSGELQVEKLSARYSQSGPKVLHDISFNIKSGERIGIVGRTGSGKSSLTLALLRCILTEGTVYYDGIPTNTINLDALRSNITIIPQTPELISGTLRQNLDPFDQNDDVALNDALRSAGLFSLQEDAGEARITLETKISGGGGNLSVGQRQIIALARAMVRGSKLLILDEATSAIDYKTDAVIQSTLRSQLASDVTVITVAHRLQTIMDADKIMVLDGGRIVEFDIPQVLLKKENGVLKEMVDGSGDKKALYLLAGFD